MLDCFISIDFILGKSWCFEEAINWSNIGYDQLTAVKKIIHWIYYFF